MLLLVRCCFIHLEEIIICLRGLLMSLESIMSLQLLYHDSEIEIQAC